jgi:hypothetical protein
VKADKQGVQRFFVALQAAIFGLEVKLAAA